MGSSLFKIPKFFNLFNTFNFFYEMDTLKENKSEDQEFSNYLEDYSQYVRHNQINPLKKSKFVRSQILNEKEDENSIDKITYTIYTNSKNSLKPKNLKTYFNDAIEKDFIDQKLLNKRINRKMRKKIVNNFSTTDTIY